MNEPQMRIGSLARRVGVAPETLRAWERRYGVPSPGRTSGGYRLYGPGEESRVRRMLGHIASGVAPAQAAELVRTDSLPPVASDALLREELVEACSRFDAATAHALIDAARDRLPLRELLQGVLLGCLRDVGLRWESGAGSIAEEHFASGVIRERLLALGRDWDSGGGPRALLACPSGERHDVGLIVAGVWLGHLGWRVTFLGPDTPTESIEQAAKAVEPAAILLAVTSVEPEQLTLPRVDAPIHVVGPAAGARVPVGDPIAVAADIDREWRAANAADTTGLPTLP